MPRCTAVVKVLCLKAALLASLACLNAYAQEPAGNAVLGHEDEWVRVTYSKFAYLTSIHEVVHAAMADDRGETVDTDSLTKKINDTQLVITVRDIKTGPIAEILQLKWFEQADRPLPPDQVLEVQVGTDNYNEIGKYNVSWQTATAKWAAPREAPPADLMAVANTWTVQRLLDMEKERLPDGVNYTRYAKYKVTMSYQGRTETYRAICLFGVDGKGVEKALPVDGYLQPNTFVMGGSLTSFDMLPMGLLKSRLREYPLLKQWLRSHSVRDARCRTGAGEFCCVGDRCEVNAADVENEFAKPVDSWRKP